MNIYYISNNDTIPPGNHDLGIDISLFSEKNYLDGRKAKPDAIIIGTGIERSTEEILQKIKRNQYLCLVPVFSTVELSIYFESLYDGLFTHYSELIYSAKRISGRISDLNLKDLGENQDYRLLAFLYSRDAALLPVRKSVSRQVYVYPVADVLGAPDTNSFDWISRLKDRGLIASEKLIDRIRLCPKCEWSHLNYVDICPACQGLNISRVPFLHCFTCGHVAPQEKFLIKGMLLCPNCQTRLRHIGSDYDRPMENYSCFDCDQSFVEPQIIADCMHCGNKNSPEDLVPCHIHSYKLTAKGVYAVKIGDIEDIYALFDNLNYVTPKYFTMLLDWFLGISQRYPEDAFSIIGISIKNAIELTASIGKNRVAKLIDTFAGRLRELIRTTDITTRSSDHNLWILLPKTPSAGCTVLARRIMNLREMTKQHDGSLLVIKQITYTAPDDYLQGETSELLIGRLTSALEEEPFERNRE